MSSLEKKQTLNTDRSRLIKDRFAQLSISAGGVMVLLALLLIFFYLLYVVEPVFESAKVEQRNTFAIENVEHVVGLGIEEQTEFAYVLYKQGEIAFYTVGDQQFGNVINSTPLNLPSRATSFANSAPFQGLYGYGLENGSVMIVAPKFSARFDYNQRVLTPEVSYPLGKNALQVAQNSSAITRFAFTHEEKNAAVLALTADKRVLFTRFNLTDDALCCAQQWSVKRAELDFSGRVDELLLTPDAKRAFVRSANQIYVYDTLDTHNITLIQVLSANEENANIVSSKLLAGANSLMLVNDNAVVSQWFEVNNDSERVYKKVRTFNVTQQANMHIYGEYYRRSFFTTGENGLLGLYYTSSDSTLWQGQVSEHAITQFAIAPRANAAVILAGKDISVLNIKNEHPEVTWSALWQEVWYENYPEPSYVWQSSSASDDFEPKFSLVPITFGTLKAAFYAMLFAVPIAVSSAIYTAYFMSDKLRKIVKPTVETMEALPTVILGFLAGLWLAPIIEQYLPAIIALLFLLPGSILATALAYSQLPARIREQLPEGFHALLLIPVIILITWLSFAMSPTIELWFFDGHTRQYLTSELGMTYDQRNSLVVGLAMGFAVIPTIFTIAEDAVFSVPKHLSNGSLALGATKWQTLMRVVLLTASPGIFSAIMMGLGRAVGETMIVLMATGNTPIMDWSVFQGMRTLAANIAIEMPESETGSSHYRILFLAAFVLFIFTFIFNTVAEYVRQQLREKYSSM
ncbi:ABC transporter permease subunit [Pseudoalteromonas sp. MMG010]|uniref:ABC transporter permease subunit n=1 Tax=Pseudoalteromonas sp. MMG010 TaxID=2822685 RepID=UPI001B39E825|nr:ABC transporter permease subunit [Pseudoalteromonas sp. MMG010]MBQ4834270.1 ABC transporter permease subunit [Pseudoalteromonas sp. MMG010]